MTRERAANFAALLATGGQGDRPHGQNFTEEDIRINAFSLSHDAAEPLGFTVEDGVEKLAVVTDTGIITDEIYEAINDSDLLVFEANHDEQMLMFGEYPYRVKVRIKSDRGHLSNDYAGGVLARILGERKNGHGVWPPGRIAGQRSGRPPLRIMLAHLSFHNNIPLFARQTVEDILYKNGFIKGEDYLLDVAAKEGLTFMPEEGEEH
jgi:phosphoribosyl 1,2-cyclic phosphodiesterase